MNYRSRAHSEIKAVLFDVYGVIISSNSTLSWKQQADDLAVSCGAPNRISKEGIASIMTRLDRGEISEATRRELLAKALGANPAKINWKSQRALINREINMELLDLVAELKRNYKTAMLSNVTRSYYLSIVKMVDLSVFDYKFASCHMGVSKPDSKIFEMALKRMRLDPGEALFIDDFDENVSSASKMGIGTIRFTNNEELLRGLCRLNVISK